MREKPNKGGRRLSRATFLKATGSTLVLVAGANVYHAISQGVFSNVYNVLWYGAKNDGSSYDNIGAINAAIEAASAAGGAVVYLPAGTYEIWPNTTNNWIRLKSKVILQGDGVATVLKVRANNGNYTQIMTGTTPATLLEEVMVRNLRIDQNVANVTNTDITRGANGQYAILSYNFRNIQVQGVNFDPCSGVNTVTFNSPAGERAKVANCRFNFVMGTSVAGDYDNSAIYMHCSNHSVLGNVLVARGASFGKARGAIETHGMLSVIANNRSSGYRTGVNVVSESSGPERPSNDLHVIGNTFMSCNDGVQLWAVTGYILRNVNISKNIISVAQVDHDQETCTGIAMAFSTQDVTRRGTYDDVRIADNRIYFQDESSSGRSQTTGGTTLTNSNTYAIGLQYYGPINNVEIIRNYVQNAPLKGMHAGSAYYPTRGVRVAKNTFVNCGTNIGVVDEDGNPHPYRSVVFLDYELHDVTVENNRIISTHDAPMGIYTFYVNPAAGSNRVELRQNEIVAKQGSYRYSSVQP